MHTARARLIATLAALALLAAACGGQIDHPPYISTEPWYPTEPVATTGICITPRTDADPPATVTSIVINEAGIVSYETRPLDPDEENREVAARLAEGEARGSRSPGYCDAGH